MLAKLCYPHKQHFARWSTETDEVPKKPAIDVLAENLARHMAGRTQAEIGKAADISQRGVGYLLRPDTRQASKSGAGSPTIHKVEAVANALGVEVWELLCPMDSEMWTVFQAAKRLRQDLQKPESAGEIEPAVPDRLQANRR